MLIKTLKAAKKVIVGIIGGTIVLLGAILLFTPGPAAVVIFLGLGVLGSEFIWAKLLLERLKQKAKDGIELYKKFRNRKKT
ncbi:PGPGW domain-containing protein [Candidatus Woesearchaeota archaeon]|nr:PGPGW domain-containing protein [Candidatus Woesearchaeota archaeon]